MENNVIPSIGCTLDALSQAKHLPKEFLQELGLTEVVHKGNPAVAIPYREYYGKTIYQRLRIGLTRSTGPCFHSPAGCSAMPYGRERLKGNFDTKQLIIVEGESDCWALWHNRYHALGLPGATNTSCLELKDVSYIPAVYVYSEPDAEGEKFPIRVKAYLRSLEYNGKVLSFRLSEGYKDPSELWCHNPHEFEKLFDLAILEAKEIPDPVPQQIITATHTAVIDSYDRVSANVILEKYIEMAKEGAGRNTTGHELACQLRDNGYTEPEANEVIRQYASAVPDKSGDPYTEQEALASVRSAFQKQARSPWPKNYGLTDLGNAERFRDECSADVKYSPAMGWIVYDGKRWEANAEHLAIRKATAMIKKMGTESWDNEQSDTRKKHAIASQSRSRIEAMMALAKNLDKIHVNEDIFDKSRHLLNVKNGTIDLRTGILLPHNKEHYLTKISPVEYHPSKTSQIWINFVESIMSENQNLVSFLQKAVGYSATGEISEQCLFFLLGCGSNGKSTFVEQVRTCLGDYAQKAPTEMIMEKSQGSIPNDIARLCGSRMAIMSETEQGKRLAESRVKDLTGADQLSARFLHREYFEFYPTHKLWVYGNHKPEIRGTDEGIWRRIRLIPFLVTFDADRKDPALPEKLKNELSGILSWIVQGAMEWYQSGLGEPVEIKEATFGYRSEMDVMGQFLSEVLVQAPNASGELAKPLYDAYCKWMQEHGETPGSNKSFSQALTERGIQKKSSRYGTIYLGLSFKSHPNLKKKAAKEN